MRLKKLIKASGIEVAHQIDDLVDFKVHGISCNSKSVDDGYIFVAVKGEREDGNSFIDEAISKGAKAIIVQSNKPEVRSQRGVPIITVKDVRKAQARLAAEFYGHPSSKIKVSGVTGTNGKTTITYLMEAVLKEANFSPGVIGTVSYRFKDKLYPAKNTTPGPIELQSLLREMLNEGIDYCLIEVSSHALDQDRTEGINFHSGLFTNLTQDHLDYHQTIENYFRSKLKLFHHLSAEAFAVINNDDAFGRRIKASTKAKIITYGLENDAMVSAKNIKFRLRHTEFQVVTAKGEMDFTTQLIGRHNVYNILAVVAWAQEEGISLSTIKSALKKFSYVPGRLERIDSDSAFAVFVDYAHTEDALSNIIQSLRQVFKKRIIVVFGCGGDRDKTKRPKMGYVVSEFSDYAIITNDNPRSEEPLEIIADIKRGIKKDNYAVIPDRLEAIKKSLGLAEAGDVVLIAGKGHEDYQILKDRVIHFDDREVVRECLKEVSKTAN